MRLKSTPRWKPGRKVWMRISSKEPFEHFMVVVESEYEMVRGGWDYRVKAQDGTEYHQLVKETDLKRA